MIQYMLNGEVVTSEDNLTLQQILQNHIENVPSGIAVAVDDEIVPRLHWGTRTISNNQKILIVTATQGG